MGCNWEHIQGSGEREQESRAHRSETSSCSCCKILARSALSMLVTVDAMEVCSLAMHLWFPWHKSRSNGQRESWMIAQFGQTLSLGPFLWQLYAGQNLSDHLVQEGSPRYLAFSPLVVEVGIWCGRVFQGQTVDFVWIFLCYLMRFLPRLYLHWDPLPTLPLLHLHSLSCYSVHEFLPMTCSHPVLLLHPRIPQQTNKALVD